MSKTDFLDVNLQRNVDGTEEAELGSAEVKRPDSRWHARDKKHEMAAFYWHSALKRKCVEAFRPL